MMHPALEEIVRTRLRCPVCSASQGSVPRGDGDGVSVIRCAACGFGMTLSPEGLLTALPPHLADAARDNITYYDGLARDNSRLLQRSRGRNHRSKCGAVLRHLRLAGGGGGRTVLEFGVGLGSHAGAVAETGAAYAGLDISPGLLQFIQKDNPALRGGLLAAADVMALPFQESSFDAVFCVAALHHLVEPLDGVRELLRVLKPGGRFCFVEPNRFYPSTLLGYLRNPKVEVGVMRTTRSRVLRCVRALNAAEAAGESLVYTPNRPASLIPLYDRADRLLGRMPLGGLLSVMFCVYGAK